MTLFWSVLFLGGLVLLQAAVARRFALKGVSYARRFNVTRAYAGDAIELVETVTNDKRLPVPWLRLETALPAFLKFHENVDVRMSEGSRLQHHRSFFSLSARYFIRAAKRGIYALDTVHLTSGDIFGLSAVTASIAARAELVVYPALMADEEISPPTRQSTGERLVRRWIHPDPFLVGGIRPYRAGDSVRDVHWRATARTGDLMVKVHDYTSSEQRVVLLCLGGLSVPPEQASDALERAISLAATLLVNGAKHAGVEVGFGCDTILDGRPGLWLPPGTVTAEQLLETMARIDETKTVMLSRWLPGVLPRLGADAEVLLIACEDGEQVRWAEREIARRGHPVEVLVLQPSGRGGSREAGDGHEAV